MRSRKSSEVLRRSTGEWSRRMAEHVSCLDTQQADCLLQLPRGSTLQTAAIACASYKINQSSIDFSPVTYYH